MTSKKIAPSRIARTMAAAQWPDVQAQYKIAKGTYGFSCAGHGGIIAVVGVADLNERAVEIAREQGKIGYVLFEGRRSYTSEHYQIGADTPGVIEVLVGEEDCDWALVILAQNDPQATLTAAHGRYLAEGVTLDEVADTAKSWNPDFYEALTGEVIPVEQSYIKRERKFAADNAENYVVVSASGSWHEKCPEGYVLVSATLGGQRNGEAWDGMKHFLVPEARYAERRNGHFVITDEQEIEDYD